MNVLAIGAHFDDVEIGCAGAIAKHRAQGDTVTILVITHSKYENHKGEIMREQDTALKEGQDAARMLDAELICLGYETKKVQFDYRLIEDINRIIDDRKIDLIYTHWDQDVHQDHQAIGRATLAAGRKVKRLMMYQSNLYMNTQQFHANYYVDISDFIELKMKAIMAHVTEVKKFGPDWLNFWHNEALSNGKLFDVKCAEAYQLVKYLE